VGDRLCLRLIGGIVLPSVVLGLLAGRADSEGLAVVALLLALGLGGLMARTVAGPILSAIDAARCIARGGFDARMPEAGPRELRQLARAVNDLAAQRAQHEERLRRALEEAANQRDRFQAIVSATSDGLLLYDADRRLVATNQRCADLLGFSIGQLLTSDVSALQQSVQRRSGQPERYLERLERHFALPDRPFEDVLTLVEPRRLILRRSSAPVLTAGGTRGRVFTYTDVTAEHDIDRLSSEFVSMASHELRTPLTSVHGALQLAMSGSARLLAAEDREMLEISLTNTERLVRLVNDLLDLSKIEAGRMPSAPRAVEMARVLEDAGRGIQGMAAMRGSRIAIDQGEPGLAVMADPDQLLRVVTNLLSNALKYSPAGSIVRLRARGTADGVECSVDDEGPGIAPDQVERLFRPFSRVGAQERQMTGGTGLGLAISRAIVEQHGGRIWVERAGTGGSRFMFVLPRAGCPDQVPAHAA
jgi:signal transduction histidine kinase